MILYVLACDSGHRFETWFRDSMAFEDQAGRKLVECPTCRSSSVAKTIMAPAVLSTRSKNVGPAEPAPGVAAAPLLDESQRATRALIKAVRDRVMAEGHDVGSRFPEEARRMHGGDIPHRQIHGQASPDEVVGLLEDGIMVLPLPMVPDDLN